MTPEAPASWRLAPRDRAAAQWGMLALVAGVALSFAVDYIAFRWLATYVAERGAVAPMDRLMCFIREGAELDALARTIRDTDAQTHLAYRLIPGVLIGALTAVALYLRDHIPGRVRSAVLALAVLGFAAFVFFCGLDHGVDVRVYSDGAWYHARALTGMVTGAVSLGFAAYSVPVLVLLVLAARQYAATARRIESAEAEAARATEAAVDNARTLVKLAEDFGVGGGAGIAAYDLDTHRYLAMNRAGRMIYGDGEPSGPPGLFERPYYAFLAPGEGDRAAAIGKARRDAILAGERDPGYDGLRLRLANGRWIEFHQEDRDGALVGVLMFKDVTADVAAEDERREREARAEHELRTLRIQADIKNLLPPRDHG